MVLKVQRAQANLLTMIRSKCVFMLHVKKHLSDHPWFKWMFYSQVPFTDLMQWETKCLQCFLELMNEICWNWKFPDQCLHYLKFEYFVFQSLQESRHYKLEKVWMMVQLWMMRTWAHHLRGDVIAEKPAPAHFARKEMDGMSLKPFFSSSMVKLFFLSQSTS